MDNIFNCRYIVYRYYCHEWYYEDEFLNLKEARNYINRHHKKDKTKITYEYLVEECGV